MTPFDAAQGKPPATILVVDDEAGVLMLFREWLGEAGYHCLTAASAAEALPIAADGPVDVVVVDLRLPGEDGVWLARRLRRDRDDLALILVSGVHSFQVAVEGMRIGIMDYLLKPFTRTDLLQAVARALGWRQAVLASRAERARLEHDISARSEELSKAFADMERASSATLEALLVTLSARNTEAFAHAKRVARLAVSLAAGMNLEARRIADVERGALLHDIGKVALPDSLIHKPGPLTEEEIAVIRTHPAIGHDILAVVPSLRPAAEIVLASHEWFDGTGYPRRLAGQAIPIGARIVTVADTFDALTSTRVYRDPISIERASAELVRCAGTQFDPDVVHVWLRLADSTLGGFGWRTEVAS